MTTHTLGRPLSPSLSRQLAQFLALADPRCMSDDHPMVVRGFACPACHMDMTPREWGP